MSLRKVILSLPFWGVALDNTQGHSGDQNLLNHGLEECSKKSNYWTIGFWCQLSVWLPVTPPTYWWLYFMLSLHQFLIPRYSSCRIQLFFLMSVVKKCARQWKVFFFFSICQLGKPESSPRLWSIRLTLTAMLQLWAAMFAIGEYMIFLQGHLQWFIPSYVWRIRLEPEYRYYYLHRKRSTDLSD